MTLDYEFMGQDIPVLLRALPATITLTLWSMLVALLFAVACGAFILVRIPVLKQLVIVINTFIKGVPLVIQLLFCYYAVPIVAKGLDGFLGYHFDPRNPPYFPAAVLALGLNFGAYITDVVVSSVRAIDHGQIEAGKACGMRRREIIWHILLPQVVVVSIPDMAITLYGCSRAPALPLWSALSSCWARRKSAPARITISLKRTWLPHCSTVWYAWLPNGC